ncbi:MAG: TIGR02234 family membrane protein [Mycobacterium sp.]
MTDSGPDRGRATVRLAQVFLVVAAGGLWAASRLPWVIVRSFDGLGQPKQVAVTGGSWSTALLPLALLSLAAAVAAMAVHGWRVRALAVLTAVASLAAGYLAIGMWAVADIAARAADIADVSTVSLLGADRRYAGATVTLVAAVCILCGAALLMRSASSVPDSTGKYVLPAARRSAARRAVADPDNGAAGSSMSERMIWDALDEGCDPTDRLPEADAEGR